MSGECSKCGFDAYGECSYCATADRAEAAEKRVAELEAALRQVCDFGDLPAVEIAGAALAGIAKRPHC